jgi:hypothetical protein
MNQWQLQLQNRAFVTNLILDVLNNRTPFPFHIFTLISHAAALHSSETPRPAKLQASPLSQVHHPTGLGSGVRPVGDCGDRMKLTTAAACAGVLLSAAAAPAAAQTIYPINRAQILTGATFDLKVEFPGAPAPAELKVTINGEDATRVLGKTPEIIANEDGFPQTAY